MIYKNLTKAQIDELRPQVIRWFRLDSGERGTKMGHDTIEEWAKLIFGTDDIKFVPNRWVSKNDKDAPVKCAKMKMYDFISVNSSYSHVRDFCNVLGVTNLYDIGCQSINQSFLFADKYSKISYTGITDGSFDLIDFQNSDIEEGYYNIITSRQTPPAFYNGKIRYISGHYPTDCDLEVSPNNIAVALHSFTMISTEDEIIETANALVRDFERVMFDIHSHKPNLAECWKKQDWGDFKFYPVAKNCFFGTKFPEDIPKLEAMYVHENGMFATGVTAPVQLGFEFSNSPFEDYTEW